MRRWNCNLTYVGEWLARTPVFLSHQCWELRIPNKDFGKDNIFLKENGKKAGQQKWKETRSSFILCLKDKILAIDVSHKITSVLLSLAFSQPELHDYIPKCNSNLNSRDQYLDKRKSNSREMEVWKSIGTTSSTSGQDELRGTRFTFNSWHITLKN